MFSDPHCLDKFSALLLGIGVAGASLAGMPAPAGALEGAIAATGLHILLRDKRHADAANALRTLRDDLDRNWQAWSRHSSHADDGLRHHVVASFETVIDRITLTRQEAVAVHASARRVADLLVDKAAKAEPDLYDSRGVHDTDRNLTRDFLHTVTRQAYGRLLANRDYFDALRPALWQVLLDGQTRIDATTQATKDDTGEILALVRDLHNTHVPESTLIAIARKIRPQVADRNQALKELERAADIAADMAARGATPGNTDAHVDSVLRRLAELTAAGDLDAAATEADRAFAEWEERQAREAANGARLLNGAIDQHLLAYDAEAAAKLIARRVEMDTADPTARFDALLAEQDIWYERGRDAGLALDLRVSIALARLAVQAAADPDQRGAALNNLGNALRTLGERETGTNRLEQAVDAYRDALLESTRDRVPLDWAMTQNNLGAALQTLGERETGTDRLEQAVDAYRDALLERTRDRVPLQWAMTQNNLGAALQTLGERETGTDRLEQAVDAYRDALLERTRDRVPLQWAMTQNNLGIALQTLGARETGTDRLKQAVDAYRDALLERTRDRVPLQWGATQNNFGNALQTLGARETGTDRLEQAVDAYRDALLERTRDRVPLDWARTQMNLGAALATLGERETGTDRLEQAVDAYRAALLERTRDRVPLDWAATQMNLGNALAIFGTRETGTDRLQQAVDAYREALLEFARDSVPLQWARTRENVARTHLTLFEKTGDRAELDCARTAIAEALEVYTEAGAAYHIDTATRLRDRIAAL